MYACSLHLYVNLFSLFCVPFSFLAFATAKTKRRRECETPARERPRSERPGGCRESPRPGCPGASRGRRARAAAERLEVALKRKERDRLIRSSASSRHCPVQIRVVANSVDFEVINSGHAICGECTFYLLFISLRFPTPSFEMFKEARHSQDKNRFSNS